MVTVFGLIVGSRGFFPEELARDGRAQLLQVLEHLGYGVVALGSEGASNGCVRTYDDALACAGLFREHRDVIDGVIVSLPNFGEEKAIANALRWAGLDVPVLVHAFPDRLREMGPATRRDAFCGKISVCNNLTQYRIPFSLTRRHVIDPSTDEFAAEIRRFARICRVVRGLRHVRIGAIGARPGAFNTVRYSERILEAQGIAVETLDLSDLLTSIARVADDDARLEDKLDALHSYCSIASVPSHSIRQMAKLGVALDRWIAENRIDATAIQCWTALEEYLGVVPCAVMSMLSEALQPSACEVDVTGALSMYALQLASDTPSALADWNNNYGESEDHAVLFHCSNFPRSLLTDCRMGRQDIIAATVGSENTYGTCIGRIKPGPLTFLRLSTHDLSGTVHGYVGEGEFTESPLSTFGGVGVARIPDLGRLLRTICRRGFEHHVAVSRSTVAEVLYEALKHYLGWEIMRHPEEELR